MITADTITDEQIRELWSTQPNAITGVTLMEALGLEHWPRMRKPTPAEIRAARARCAEIINARRRFFVADNQGITYSFVALDVDQCRAILVKHGCVFYAPDGGETYDIERADIEWVELAPEQAAIRMTSDDGAEDPALRRLPLSQRAIGDWFCSEH